jgi:hypothetical protein
MALSNQKGAVYMTATPINGRLRLTYMDNVPDMRINTINPTASALQTMALANAIYSLQDATGDNIFLTIETELSN